jgi:hypothetical protein
LRGRQYHLIERGYQEVEDELGEMDELGLVFAERLAGVLLDPGRIDFYPHVLGLDLLHDWSQDAAQVVRRAHAEVLGHERRRQRHAPEEVLGHLLHLQLPFHRPQDQIVTLAVAMKH